MEKEFIYASHLPLGINIITRHYTDMSRKYRNLHFHDEIEIVYVNYGELFLDIEQESFTLTSGQVALINSKAVHKITPLSLGCTFTYIQINLAEYMTNDSDALHILNFIQDNKISNHIIEYNNGELHSIALKMISEYNTRGDAYQSYLRAYIYMIIAYMTRNKLFRSHSLALRQKLNRLMPAINYATDNFADKLSIDDVSSKINVSKYHFCKLFKDATGQTFSEFMNYLRITRAEKILLSSNKTIPEIAFECGFNSVQYFNRVFVNKYGYSPFKYKHLKKSIDLI